MLPLNSKMAWAAVSSLITLHAYGWRWVLNRHEVHEVGLVTAKALTTGTRINQGHSDLVLVPVFYAELAEASLRMKEAGSRC